MAWLLNAARQEAADLAADFREKGASGVICDAALDLQDIADEAGQWLVGDEAVVDSEGALPGKNAPVLPADVNEIMTGDLEELRWPDGSESTIRVMALDTVSAPCRAKVRRYDNNEELIVDIVDPVSAKKDVMAAATDVGAKPSASGLSTRFTSLLTRFLFGRRGSVDDHSTRKDAQEAAADTLPACGADAAAAGGCESREERRSHGSGRPWRAVVNREVAHLVDDFSVKGVTGVVRDAAADAVGLLRGAVGGTLQLMWGVARHRRKDIETSALEAV
eukprot:TRINITY_DN26569_c0_g1_i1.p1 TRINITY_DN26569_c0_g1~~TRINITY_DN26569_c0_g1_i1.p1  ORF type:complete len:293 (+),score=76.09 TRINITY_DN26569_c0_g1_i1:50-880(+)